VNTGLVLPAAAAAGFFGSTHCIGMCGAIVVLFEQGTGRSPWLRRLAYNAGRLGFYVLLGIVAGAGGAVLTRVAGVGTGLVILRLLAGLLVIAIGLKPLTSPARALAAGFLWGALPCGLVYSAVALAATGGTAAAGAAVMLAFWLGTLPALLLAGASADRLGRLRSGATARRLAGAVMFMLGVFALLPVLHMLGFA